MATNKRKGRATKEAFAYQRKSLTRVENDLRLQLTKCLEECHIAPTSTFSTFYFLNRLSEERVTPIQPKISVSFQGGKNFSHSLTHILRARSSATIYPLFHWVDSTILFFYAGTYHQRHRIWSFPSRPLSRTERITAMH